MKIIIHEHAKARMQERGVTEVEVFATLEDGEQFPAKYGRIGFRRNFKFESEWRNRYYRIKQIEVYATKENITYVVVTIMAKYF